MTREIKMHSDGGIGGPYYPAINVKVRHFPYIKMIQEEFECNELDAEHAFEYAWRDVQHTFWHELAPQIAKEYFGDDVKIFSAGRMDGWLIVDGLTDTEYWEEEDMEKWEQFGEEINKEIDRLTSDEHFLQEIEANRWAEHGAEFGNFIDNKNKDRYCIVDLKKAAIRDGYQSVIRN